MSTDQEQEPDPSSFTDCQFPLSDEQIARLQPALHRIAKRFSRCASDRDDCVQAANLALLDGRRKWRSALRCAESAMKDYARSQRRWYDVANGTGETQGPDTLSPLETLSREEFAAFQWVTLTDQEREAAILYWVQGWSQTEVGLRLGISQVTVSNRLWAVKEAIRQVWLDKRKGGSE